MAGTKRTSSGNEGGVDSTIPTRPRKAPKVSCEVKEELKGNLKGGKVIPRSTFLNKALPIHANFTHTPAAVIENEGEQTTCSDLGRIGSITMLPSVFSTGSHGWKGARRIAIELQGTDGKEKEKVQVMINVNATVVGSKAAADIEENTGGEVGVSKAEEEESQLEESGSPKGEEAVDEE